MPVVAVLVSGLVAGLAPAVSAEPVAPAIVGHCGDTITREVRGWLARWQIQCTSTQVRIRGSLRNNNATGTCARIEVTFPNNVNWRTPLVCGEGASRSFTSSYRAGNWIDADLQVYRI